MTQKLCGQAPGKGEEFSLCGMSFDAFETGDSEAPIVFAKRTDYITCPNCIEYLDSVNARFKHLRYNYLVIE